MKGLFGRKNFDIIIREYRAREVSENMVLVRVHACGVCGTDVHFLRDCTDYMPMGHEIAAEVIQTGPLVTKVEKGDRVIVEDVTMCGACEACKSGKVSLCRNGYTLNGQPGLSEYLIVHENMLNKFTQMDYLTACMTEPFAVAINAVNRAALPVYGSLIIFGMGTIGLFCAAYAKYLGAEKIIMVDRTEDCLRSNAARKIAGQYGVDEAYYSVNPDYIDLILKEHGYFDSAITAAPPATVTDALKCIKYGGNVVAVGVTFGLDAQSSININDMIFNKKSILTMLAEPGINYPLAIKLIESKSINTSLVITDTFEMTEYLKLKDFFGQDSSVIKAVMVNKW